MNKTGNKCVICETEVDDLERVDSVIKYNATYCKDCIEVAKLQKINIDHWDKFKTAEMNDSVEQRNYHREKEDIKNDLKIFTLDKYKKEYKIVLNKIKQYGEEK